MEREAGVRQALSDFLHTHSLHDSVSCVDEVVLTYLLSILDDLGEAGTVEEGVDAEHFCEMMAAYVPGFDSIASVEVWEWMFSLSGKHQQQNTDSDVPLPRVGSPHSSTLAGGGDRSSERGDGSTCGPGRERAGVEKGRSHRKSRTSVSEEEEAKVVAQDVSMSEFDGQVALLCEMFPDTCGMEVRHCLSASHGRTEDAVQLILHRQETGNSIVDLADSSHSVKNKGSVLADKQLKELTLARYSFVDTDDDKKTHKPCPIKQESKKLIRYREGQVVSTKGEKFSEIKKNDSEEMKKTYVSLKPARKYRFH